MGVGSDALRRGGPAPASGEGAASPSGERGPARPAGDSVWLILAVVGVIAVGIAFRFFQKRFPKKIPKFLRKSAMGVESLFR